MRLRRHQSLGTLGDEELMQLVARGDHASLDELYARYSARLLAYFSRMLGRDDALAQDFLHDLFLKMIERPEMFDHRRSFRTWVYSVAHNMCKNEFRRRSVRSAAALECDDVEIIDYEGRMDLHAFSVVLSSTLETLDSEMRTTFILRYQEDLSIREIAAIVNIPEGTVKSRLFNTARRLSQELYAHRPDQEIPDERFAS